MNNRHWGKFDSFVTIWLNSTSWTRTMMMMAVALTIIIIILPQSPRSSWLSSPNPQDHHDYPPPIPNHLVPIRATLRGRPSTLCPIMWIFTRLGYRAAMLGTIWMRDGLKNTFLRTKSSYDGFDHSIQHIWYMIHTSGHLFLKVLF